MIGNEHNENIFSLCANISDRVFCGDSNHAHMASGYGPISDVLYSQICEARLRKKRKRGFKNMSEMKWIGIGYTLFEYGKEKRPITMVKACPGNVMHELKKLQERMAPDRGRPAVPPLRILE